MGTNYYRIPSESEMITRKERLKNRIDTMSFEPDQIEVGFRFIEGGDDSLPFWEYLNPWEEFIEGTSIHLGKRSSGWKFCWNFHENRYYSSKEDLIEFVMSGRVVDEYGEDVNPQEFLDMAFSWGESDGQVADKEYFEKNHGWIGDPENYYDVEIDGLRVSSSTNFS